MTGFDNSTKKITRRSFLSAAGAAVSLPMILPSGVLAAQGAPGANDRLAIAFIGVGGMGGHHLGDMQRFVDSGDVNIAAVCDIDENRLGAAVEKAGPGAVPYRDYRYILERTDIDAV
ncbi:MAG: gfo/Idh/MocA family oxidoreductase, partial [Candidatus Hydrogenedentes bacterium]|nr:gfo/Idh/MocA family oxidoreductase [Candidatus Hydrogenedentota bacterium]